MYVYTSFSMGESPMLLYMIFTARRPKKRRHSFRLRPLSLFFRLTSYRIYYLLRIAMMMNNESSMLYLECDSLPSQIFYNHAIYNHGMQYLTQPLLFLCSWPIQIMQPYTALYSQHITQPSFFLGLQMLSFLKFIVYIYIYM